MVVKKMLRFVEKRHYQSAILANDLEQTFNRTILEQLLMNALPTCIEGKNIKNNFYALLTYISHFYCNVNFRGLYMIVQFTINARTVDDQDVTLVPRK